MKGRGVYNLSDKVIPEWGEMEMTFSRGNNMCKDTNLMAELQVLVEGKSGRSLVNMGENDRREAGVKAWSKRHRLFWTSVKCLGLFSGAPVTTTESPRQRPKEEVLWEKPCGQMMTQCHDWEFKQPPVITSELDPALPQQPRTFFLLDQMWSLDSSQFSQHVFFFFFQAIETCSLVQPCWIFIPMNKLPFTASLTVPSAISWMFLLFGS